MSSRQTLRAAAFLLAALSFTLSSCVSVPARKPAPEAYVETAAIPGIPHARMLGDELFVDLEQRAQVIHRHPRRLPAGSDHRGSKRRALR